MLQDLSMCHKAVNTYLSTKKVVSECCLAQEMCDKAVNTYPFAFDFVPNQYKTQEMCERVVSENPFLILYCPDKYITQKMIDEAVDNCLAALKFILKWFVTSKTIKKLVTAFYADENIPFYNVGSGDVVFNCNEMGMLDINLNNIILDDNFDKDNPDTITFIRLWV